MAFPATERVGAVGDYDGRGSRVNPGIDLHADIGADDFADRHDLLGGVIDEYLAANIGRTTAQRRIAPPVFKRKLLMRGKSSPLPRQFGSGVAM
jgi:hypothetical protein